MDESNARIKLGKAGDALLDTRHPDEDHAHGTFVKDRSHLFDAVHLQAIGLIHKDQRGRIPNPWPQITYCTAMGRMWRLSGTQAPCIFQPCGCVRSLSGEALCGKLHECDSSLSRDQAARFRRKGLQRLGLAAAPLRVLAKDRDHSASEEKTAPLLQACGLADAESESSKKSLFEGALSSFSRAKVSRPCSQKLLRDDPQA